MKIGILFSAILLTSIPAFLNAQSEYLLNPSFEIDSDWLYHPHGWNSCNIRSTPDVQPGMWNVFTLPTDGSYYIGLIMLDSNDSDGPKYEDVVTELLKPLYRDSMYSIAVDLSFAPNAYVYENIPQKFRISSVNDDCSLNEILVLTDSIKHFNWKTYNFIVSPKVSDCNFIKIEIYGDELVPSYMLVDNMHITPYGILGPDNVCRGKEAVRYMIPDTGCTVIQGWNYSGTGVTITEDADGILIDYDSTATSGILSAEYDFCGKGFVPVEMKIKVDSLLPADAGMIQGDDKVCRMQEVDYQIDPIDNTTNYIWEFEGNGIVQTYGVNNISFYFDESTIYDTISDHPDSMHVDVIYNDSSTSGILSVYGSNACGSGSPSYLTIQTDLFPSSPGTISGQHSICSREDKYSYSIQSVENATDYTWDFSGGGMSYSGNDTIVQATFAENANNGFLRVRAIGICGTETPSSSLYLNLDGLPQGIGTIVGESIVCAGQVKVNYIVEGINSADYYTWNYSGIGADINVSGDYANVDFYETASNGNLTVTGDNICGTGEVSNEFPIQINTKPLSGGPIIGSLEACFNYSESYSVEPIANATSYYWAYTGTNDSIIYSSNNIVLNFSELETSGELTVQGVNNCGVGLPSFPVFIELDDCGFHIPNSFSPNRDGTNDVFYIRGLRESAKLIVFDRFGRKVYEADKYENDWNGDDKHGNQLKSDTYWYVLKISGLPNEFKGFVYLKR